MTDRELYMQDRLRDKIDLTEEQLEAICDYEAWKRKYVQKEGKEKLLRDTRHEVIDLVMLETAKSKPNEIRVAAYREVLSIMERLLEEEIL